VAWRKSRWTTVAASWPHLHRSLHSAPYQPGEPTWHSGSFCFAAGSPADDGSPGAEAMRHRHRERKKYGQIWQGTGLWNRSTSHVRCLADSGGKSETASFPMIRQSHHPRGFGRSDVTARSRPTFNVQHSDCGWAAIGSLRH
jgi:hypothetical protein